MNKNFLFFLFFSLNIIKVKTEDQNSRLLLTNITVGIYNIILKKKFACIAYDKGLKVSKDKFGNNKLNFRITEIHEKTQNISDVVNSNIKKDKKKFLINFKNSQLYIGVKIGKGKNYPIITSKVVQNNNNTISFEWEIINATENTFYIYNKAGCYLKDNKNDIVCAVNPISYVEFYMLKLYTEVNITKEDELILEKEPIDVFIKYIDLSDSNLVREGIHQISKDLDNEELRYSVRSILTNIPWVRKIFILMPNEKVRYFKDYELISDKIVYVKDKDILGYDSSNSHAFQYRIWKLKEFGLSDNVIVMDDDYFIGQPLNKSHFFYVENNKVLPSIVNVKYEIQTNSTANKEYDNLKKKISNSDREQTSDKFMYSVYKTYLFFISYFNSSIIVPYFTHNAIPANLNDLKELYDIIYNSPHRNATLDATYRHIETVQFQSSLIVYTYNKYKRKSNPLNNNYIDNANTVNGKYNYPLFCINTGNNKDYNDLSFIKTRLVMEKLYPTPTEYEVYNSSIVPDKAFEITTILKDELTALKNQKKIDDILKENYENNKIVENFEKCMNQLDMYRAENFIYDKKNKNRKMELDICRVNREKYGKKLNKFNNYIKNKIVKDKLDKIMKDKEINEKKIIEYKNINDNYLIEIKTIKKRDFFLYIIIYVELTIIGIFVVLFCIYYPMKKKNNNKNRLNDLFIKII